MVVERSPRRKVVGIHNGERTVSNRTKKKMERPKEDKVKVDPEESCEDKIRREFIPVKNPKIWEKERVGKGSYVNYRHIKGFTVETNVGEGTRDLNIRIDTGLYKET